MTNPRNGVYPGFAYVRPAERDKDVRWNAVLMYEKPRAGTQPAESVAVLFADGSVRFMPLQELEKEAQRQEFEIVRLPAD